MALHHFSAAIIIGLCFFFFCSFPLNAEPAGCLNNACLFVGFITEADVSAGIMEDFQSVIMLLISFLFVCFSFSPLHALWSERRREV